MENKNNQQQINQSAQEANIPPVENQPQIPAPTLPGAPKPKVKITDMVKDIYINIKGKKIFKLIVVLFGLIFFIIIAGSIYSIVKRTGRGGAVLPSSSPVPTAEIVLTEESKKSKSQLEELKSKIMNLDISQKHLTPPTLDFDISF